MRFDSTIRLSLATLVLPLFLAPVVPANDAHAATNVLTHAELQAVNPDGTSSFVVGDSCPFLLRGILLNDPADMLSTDYVPGAEGRGAGAQYQVFLQGLAPDRGGTVLYMSEGTSADSYTEEEWASELARVTTDPDTGRAFQPGDYVEVTANWAMYRGGKLNVNEAHDKSPAMDFHVRLLTPAAGFPPAEPITLADLVDDAGAQIFDSTRATGGEHWQGMRVRLDAVRLANDEAVSTWNNPNPENLAWRDRLIPCTDAAGRTFNLRLPRYSLGPAPATNRWFSATGILNQENSNTDGYELFVQEIGPILDLSFDETDGSAAIAFSADYSGYQLQVSDDSGTTWTNALAFPSIIIIHDPEATPTRFYRLVLPGTAPGFTNKYDASQSATLPAGAQQAGGTLKYRPVVPGSVVMRVDSIITLSDNGNGVLGDNEGTVNYESGAWTIKLKTAWWPTQQSIKINYSYYVSNSEGVVE